MSTSRDTRVVPTRSQCQIVFKLNHGLHEGVILQMMFRICEISARCPKYRPANSNGTTNLGREFELEWHHYFQTEGVCRKRTGGYYFTAKQISLSRLSPIDSTRAADTPIKYHLEIFRE